MYAVIQTGGKQYRVKEGDILSIEKIEKQPGDNIVFDKILSIGDGDKLLVGKPVISGASVAAQVLDQTRGPKVIIFKKKRRHNYRRKNGHRQDLTLVKIFDISASGGSSKKAPEFKPREKKIMTANNAAKAKSVKPKAEKAPVKKPAAKANTKKSAK